MQGLHSNRQCFFAHIITKQWKFRNTAWIHLPIFTQYNSHCPLGLRLEANGRQAEVFSIELKLRNLWYANSPLQTVRIHTCINSNNLCRMMWNGTSFRGKQQKERIGMSEEAKQQNICSAVFSLSCINLEDGRRDNKKFHNTPEQKIFFVKVSQVLQRY